MNEANPSFLCDGKKGNTLTLGTNNFHIVKLLSAKCYRCGWEIVRSDISKTEYYFRVPSSEIRIELAVLKQPVTRRWDKELGKHHGVTALRKYRSQRRTRQIINRTLDIGV